MHKALPPLPVRRTVPPATVGTLWNTNCRSHLALLERIAAGLRALPGSRQDCRCHADIPIRSYAHAHQVMARHSGHRCVRFEEAARYAEQVRP